MSATILQLPSMPAPAANVLKGHLDYSAGWADDVAVDSRVIARRASRLIGLACLAFLAWAAFFPLSSAVVAEGVVVAQGQNKLIQHRTGGTVRDMMAAEGDRVRAGQPILRLDPANDVAELTQLRARLAVLRATQLRLEAENRAAAGAAPGAVHIAPPGSGADLGPGGSLLVAEQDREFARGRGAMQAQMASLDARIAAVRARQRGQIERIAKMEAQVALLDRQYAAKRRLAEKGGLARSALWDYQATLLSQRGELDQLRAERDAARDDIRSAEAQIAQVRLTDERETSTRLTEVIAESAQLVDRLRAAEAAVANAVVRAPVTGWLVHVKFATVGGVVPAGEAIAEIVPDAAPIAIRSHVSPQDIAHVHVGQPARIAISALNARLFDELQGSVSIVGADATVDPRTGAAYFEVVTTIPAPPHDPHGKRMVDPGMAGQVFIAGGDRTFLSYVFRPILDSLRHAFRES